MMSHYQSGKDTAAATSEPVIQLDIGWCCHHHYKQPSTTPWDQGLMGNTRDDIFSWGGLSQVSNPYC